MGLGLGLIPKQRQHACQLEFGNGGGGLKRQKAWLVAVVVDWKRKKSGDFVVFTFGIESRREYLSIYLSIEDENAGFGFVQKPGEVQDVSSNSKHIPSPSFVRFSIITNDISNERTGQLRKTSYPFDWTSKSTARDTRMPSLGTLLVCFYYSHSPFFSFLINHYTLL